MPRISTSVIATGLFSSGLIACVCTAGTLLNCPDLDTPLNPFGINRSPYGEVIAMALQGPIDVDFHIGIFGSDPRQLARQQHEAANKVHAPLLFAPKPLPKPQNWSEHMTALIAKLQAGVEQRTSPLPPNQTLKFYLRQQAEGKLRFAYQLDPSHYANYNSLHFFLAEHLGTQAGLISTTGKLADETIDYCLNKKDEDPRSILTAAAACTNILQLMFQEQGNPNSPHTTTQMRQYLTKLDECLKTYDKIANAWDKSNQWQLLSSLRVEECQTRYSFIQNIRNVSEKTIVRLEKESSERKESLN